MSDKSAGPMPPASRLGRQIVEAASSLDAIGANFALIGGLALASHQVVRATQDVDLLVELEKADDIEAVLSRLGYRCIYRSADAANYTRGDERLDLLYASRPVARRLLANAAELQTALGKLRVISAAMIAEPPFATSAGLAAPARREEDPLRALDDLMAAIEGLCPQWPARETMISGHRMLL